MSWCDAHVHLDEFPDPNKIVEEALATGVTKICAVSQFRSSWEKIISLSEHWKGVVIPAIGIHPCPDGDQMIFDRLGGDQAALSSLSGEIQTRKLSINVIGEIGLDFKWATSDAQKANQQRMFEAQLNIAQELHLPVSVHSRRCASQIVSLCSEWHRKTGLGVTLHWFTHSARLMREATKAGLFVSVGPAGAMTEKDEMKVVQTCGKECLGQMLLETDGPVKFDGKEAQPSWIPEIGASVAKLIGCSVEEVRDTTSRNFERFLRNR